MPIRVAIDGPVGAGKSTIARECAKKLGFLYIDTGALYRSVALYCKRKGVDINSDLVLGEIGLKLDIIDGTQHVIMNGEDVSAFIREPDISLLASRVSAIPEVRTFLLDLQREIAENNDIIMDGRDIGTVILPNAEVKIFLTADPKIRAKRRYDELIEKGTAVTFDEVLADLIKRDHDDSTRETAPLKKADDAVLVDSSGYDFNKTCDVIINIIRKVI